ncbi:MAG TPA: XdhC family protein [Devosia sp.]|nr:XdhC family protein [Devosia sp.]
MQDIVVPRRIALPANGPAHGESVGLFDLLQAGIDEGVPQALVTLVEVEGGASRAIGTQMAVLADGRYAGYVSGGCVEAAVAAEAMKAIAAGEDTILRFGVGSPFFDIKLPCGGSIELHVHACPDPKLVAEVRRRLRERAAFAVEFVPAEGAAQVIGQVAPGKRTGWRDESFLRCYAPVTRLLLIGRGAEIEQAVRIGTAAGLDIVALCADEQSLATAEGLGATALLLTSPRDVPDLPADAWTATIFLFHDHDWEPVLLAAALKTDCFLVGAMGSRRAHGQRRERLLAAGVGQPAIERIRGPIGLFGPARDAASLAISILAEVTERRIAFDAP